MTKKELMEQINDATRKKLLYFFCTFDFFKKTIPHKNKDDFKEFLNNIRNIAFETRTSFVINPVKKEVEFVSQDVEILLGMIMQTLDGEPYFDLKINEFISNCCDDENIDSFIVKRALEKIAVVLHINCSYIQGINGDKMRYHKDNLKFSDALACPKFSDKDMKWEDINE